MTGQLLGGGITNEAAIALRLVNREEADRHRFGLCRCHGFGGTLAEQLARAQRLMRNAPYYTQAREFGQLVAQYSQNCPAADKLFICTGGGPGVMEAANRGAADVGAPSVGLTIDLPKEERANPYVPEDLAFKFHYFAIRKMHFMMRAKALVAFPGGFGTLDELFEVLTLVQTRKAKPVPIFLFGSAYWKKIINFEALADEGAISPEDLKLFTYVDDPQTAWHEIKRFYALSEAK
ncbi:MAG: TIGR00730 family Rossman fold protein [Brachymonas sp.]|nr:TIGR00730 family Rossman fold protein [Brachymonas sp.]